MRNEATRIAGNVVRFRPSRVEGIENVEEVCVSGESLELVVAGGQRLRFAWLDVAPGREVSSGRAPVGEMYWAKDSYADSRFVFYTTPRVVVYMPADGPTRWPHSAFWRVQEVLREGGFKLYDGAPARPPAVLDARPGKTAVYVLLVLGFAWAYALAGFLPGAAGEGWRHFLLSNPRNPSIGFAFMLPAMAVPMLLAFRHGAKWRTVAAIVAGSWVLALASEWAMRRVIHPWAALEGPPFDKPFWTGPAVGSLLGVVTIVAVGSRSWRRSYLEPVVREKGAGPGMASQGTRAAR